MAIQTYPSFVLVYSCFLYHAESTKSENTDRFAVKKQTSTRFDEPLFSRLIPIRPKPRIFLVLDATVKMLLGWYIQKSRFDILLFGSKTSLSDHTTLGSKSYFHIYFHFVSLCEFLVFCGKKNTQISPKTHSQIHSNHIIP
jgi:hypothetical protein